MTKPISRRSRWLSQTPEEWGRLDEAKLTNLMALMEANIHAEMTSHMEWLEPKTNPPDWKLEHTLKEELSFAEWGEIERRRKAKALEAFQAGDRQRAQQWIGGGWSSWEIWRSGVR